jgi:4-amino-4-deoxy-L-arabinose transferase-like glycosyltransferase
MKKMLREHTGAVVILVLFITLGTTYSLVTPLFEASDEISHYPVVQHIATTGTLPVQRPGVETLWEQEGSQPPLYYLLSAALTFWIDTSDLQAIRWRNPHAKLGIPLDPDNKNMVIHTQAEAFPWRGTVLAMHLIRFFSVALGTGTVALTYHLIRMIWPEDKRIALLGMALVAFNPMFLFITGSVNNDNLMVMLGTWLLVLTTKIVKEGLTARRSLTLAVVTALATITKISGLTLVPVVGLALLIHALKRRQWKQVLLTGLGLTAAWLVLAGWWYARNLILYQELLGTNTHVAIVGGRQIGLWELRREWYGFWVSYWALFGAVDILADQEAYLFYAVISWLAVAGLIWWAIQVIRRRAWNDLLLPALMALQVAITFAGVLRWTTITYASQGRLMFPVIGAISGLMAYGLLNWLPPRLLWRTAGLGIVAVPLLVVAAIAPFRYIAPTYALPPSVSEIPATATPVGVEFGGLELVAVETYNAAVQAGEHIPITLYWRANRPLEQNYSLYLHALGRGYEEIGKIDSYPGAGALPTTLMQPGVIIRDSYSIRLREEFTAPTIVRVAVGVGLWQPELYIVLRGNGPDGQPLNGDVIVEAGVAYPRDFAGCTGVIPEDVPQQADFGGFARLWARPISGNYQAGDTVPVTLYWERLTDTPVNWTVFVHLVGTDRRPLAQGDGPPVNGDYPTSLWRADCQIEDSHLLILPADLPAGDYSILVGLYDTTDPAYRRALATRADGSPYPDHAVPLGNIHVEAP